MSKAYMMLTIANRSFRKRYKDFLEESGLDTGFAAHGEGTASHEILNYFGLEAAEKIIYFSIVTEETWKKVRRQLITKMHIDVPGAGIALIIPVSSVGGKNVLQCLTQNQSFEKEEESKLKETKYELLIAIANQGSIDNVMDAARSANAGGGTVIHAKGTGVEKAEKFLGVSLAEEKEVILIVTKTSKKKAIMKAIMDKCGLESKEKAIIFSLPVTSVVGMRILEEEDIL